jgi:glycosyltransferase involved in cell wall biosynthesis
MRIAVNTRLLITGKLSGIGWFAYHTLKRIVKWYPEHQFVFLFDRKYDEEFIFGPNVSPEIIFPPTRHPLLWYLWFEHAIVKKVKKYNPALFYSPDGHLSLKIKDIPSLPVIHDINFHHDKKGVPYFDGLFWRHYFPKYARMASRILTVSEFSKNDISSYYNISRNLIDVAYNGANEIFEPVSLAEKESIKKKYTRGEDYFLYVGVLVPRKNISRMIQAFDRFKDSSGSRIKLVIVGDRLFFTSEMEKSYNRSKHKEDIIFTGSLEQSELKMIMGAALSLILVSCLEGFGIPIIEAMNADVPVITSNISSMPEVAGDAALLADPYSIDSIADAMMKISSDEKLRDELIAKGKSQRIKYSWDNTASAVWNSIEKVAESKRDKL